MSKVAAIQTGAVARADTSKASGGVDTCAPIVARILVKAFVDINCTKFSGETTALTNGAIQTLLTHSVVLTGIWIAILAIVTPLAA
jgi:hypothetical protein